MESIKVHIKNFLKKHENLRKKARIVNIYLKKIQYKRMAKKVKVDNKLILFETFMGRQYGCNPRAIYEYMITDNRFDDYRFIWVFKDLNKAQQFKALERAETVLFKSKAYYRYYAAAKYVITNSNLDYQIIKKDEQIFLQTWHGTPLKRLRCDIEAERGNVNNTLEEIKLKNDMDVIRYDYFLSPSAFASDKFISAFNLKALGKENIILETGYPRNDILSNYKDSDLAIILKELNLKNNKKILLYAPTFRDNQHDSSLGYVYDLCLDFDRLREELSDEYIVLFRAHYFVANQFDFDKYKGFVYDVSAVDDITKLYLISDMLVTDYSSVFFDYANSKRPMIFYMYDLDEYANDIRGFYIDINELPGSIVKNEEELIKYIKNNNFIYDDKYKAFNKKYNYLDDGNASQRVVEKCIKYV